MADADFVPFRLTGGRFDEHDSAGFPLEALSELVRYERLLIQVARGLWLGENKQRKRVSRRFEESLKLELTAVDVGSVVPSLRRREPDAEGRLFDERAQLFERSRETIIEALYAAVSNNELPESFPQSAQSPLLQFGTSLQRNEQALFERGAEPIVYDQVARRKLQRIVATQDFEVDGHLVGRVGKVDPDRQEFEFYLRDGQHVGAKFERPMIDLARRNMERAADAPVIRLTCRYVANDEGQPTAVENVFDMEDLVGPDDPKGERLKELVALPDGWLDGEGSAVEIGAIEWARDFLAEIPSETVDAVRVFPTAVGGVLLERDFEAGRWSLEIEPDGTVGVTAVGVGEPGSYSELEGIEGAVASFLGFAE